MNGNAILAVPLTMPSSQVQTYTLKTECDLGRLPDCWRFVLHFLRDASVKVPLHFVPVSKCPRLNPGCWNLPKIGNGGVLLHYRATVTSNL